MLKSFFFHFVAWSLAKRLSKWRKLHLLLDVACVLFSVLSLVKRGEKGYCAVHGLILVGRVGTWHVTMHCAPVRCGNNAFKNKLAKDSFDFDVGPQ